MRVSRNLIICLLFISLFLPGCRPTERKRAIGYLRIGPLSQFAAPEVHLPAMGLLVRRDGRGFYAMSTLCTYDLSHLEFKDTPQGKVWSSQYNDSQYDNEGHVVRGPAKADLPFLKMVLEANVLPGPKDTLYVMDGIEVSRDWRLKVPEPETAPAQ